MGLDFSVWYVIAGVAIAVAIGYWFLKRPSRHKPVGALEDGWQFYSNPTTLEPPGTVFRIDPNGRRYLVDALDVPVQAGAEAAATVEETVEASVGVVAKFIGLEGTEANAGGARTERFQYEISHPIREYVTDAGLRKPLDAFLNALDFRVGHRYFLIRDVRKASAMKYRLTTKQVDNLGGAGTVSQQVSIKGNVFSSERNGSYVLDQQFTTPMRVMFLPEEIRPITAGLGNERPVLGTVPVTRPLFWVDAPQAEESSEGG